MHFEWDPEKSASNNKKHKVSFGEAVSAFHDPLSATVRDPEFSIGEERYLMFGVSAAGKLLAVSYTERGDAIRLISARPATRAERGIYEKG